MKRRNLADHEIAPHGRVDVQPERRKAPAETLFTAPFLWPLVATAAVGEMTAAFLNDFAGTLLHGNLRSGQPNERAWTTPNRVALELQCMRLRDFSVGGSGVPTLICAPFALHDATIADFAPGHSLVQTLCASGLQRVHVTEWRSATPDMRLLSIDNYLSDLNVAIDEFGRVDLVGLCQGGWMALVYAARFPNKVRRLVLAGAPIDIAAGVSKVSQLAAELPLSAFEEIVHLGDGRVLGQKMLELWAPALDTEDAQRILQLPEHLGVAKRRQILRRFERWCATTVDLPGTYYLQVVRWLFKENRIAEGRFDALGRAVNLADVRAPTFLFAARDDELVAADQLFATTDCIGTPRAQIETAIEPCGHLSLFLGACTLSNSWARIARWLLLEDLADQ